MSREKLTSLTIQPITFTFSISSFYTVYKTLSSSASLSTPLLFRLFEKLNNAVDLGLKPASGLKSPQWKALQPHKLEEDADLENKSGLLTSQQLAEIKSMCKEVSEITELLNIMVCF